MSILRRIQSGDQGTDGVAVQYLAFLKPPVPGLTAVTRIGGLVGDYVGLRCGWLGNRFS